MKYIDKIGLTLLVTLIVSSCNDFLDEKPKKGDGIELETFEQLEAVSYTHLTLPTIYSV